MSIKTYGTDSTAPTLQSAVIASNGTTLTLSFSENVNQDTDYADSDLNVAISGGNSDVSLTYVSGDGTNSHVYTIGEEIQTGATVDLDITDNTDCLVDDADNNLDTVSNFSITNQATPGSGKAPVVYSSGGAEMIYCSGGMTAQ